MATHPELALPRRLPELTAACLLLCLPFAAGCRAQYASNPQQITYGTRLVLLESGIHWAEWINKDGSDCGDVYKWNDQWMADTYRDGLSQRPFDTKDEAVAWVQRWCK